MSRETKVCKHWRFCTVVWLHIC